LCFKVRVEVRVRARVEVRVRARVEVRVRARVEVRVRARVEDRVRARVEVRVKVSRNTFKYVFGQTSIRASVLDPVSVEHFHASSSFLQGDELYLPFLLTNLKELLNPNFRPFNFVFKKI